MSLSPVHAPDGRLTHVVGIQLDVTARMLAIQEREDTLETAQLARADAERAQRRLALLAEATTLLAATLDVETSLTRLTGLVVPLMAEWCAVHLLAADGEMQRVASNHRDAALLPLLRRLEELQPAGLSAGSRARAVLEGGPAVLLDDITPEMLAQGIADDELLTVYRALDPRCVIVVPLSARQQVLGSLTLVTSSSGRTYDESDLAVAADLGRRAALAVDNARLYQREHHVAEALQRSLLPRLPVIDGLDRAARYLPSGAASHVGGDWYDLLALPDGSIGVAIGDVMGHDLTAAAAMGQLRSVLRSYAWRGLAPADVLDQLDELVQGLDMAQLATAIYGRIDLPTPAGPDHPAGPGRLRWANAGHLPPALRRPDGTVQLLTGEVSLLVGAAPGVLRAESEVALEPGSVLVLYTDGLVEHRGLDLDAGLARLQASLAAAPAGSAEGICDALLADLTSEERDDDVALLAIRVEP